MIAIQEEQKECPICMDVFVGITNRVVTDCGHCFHTNCLMKNVAHNGFGCPYCRAMMAEEPEDDDDSYISVENPSTRRLDLSSETLISIRNLFQEEGDEDEEEDCLKPPIEYLAQKMEEQGFTLERLIKACLIEYEEYDDIEDECMREADSVFEALQILITNFSERPHQQEQNEMAIENST